MLTQQQFELLTQLVYGRIEKLSLEQEQLIANMGIANNDNIIESAKSMLEPYRVRRAIFLAAGIGNRLRPITINTPKPLVRVNGKRMIDTLLDAVIRAEIDDIIIVRGYLAQQFEELKTKYPTIRFVDNPHYDSQNNISSAVLIKDYVENAYILEADLVLKNPDLITPYQYRSNYLGVFTDKTTDWCFETSNNRITKISCGGESCHHMFGISYWNSEDGRRLGEDLVRLYEGENGKQSFWDFAALRDNIESYSIFVRECSFDDIVEIDGYDELKQIDKSYI